MPVTQCDLDWLAVRLLPAIHDINQHQKHKRITERLRSLLNELEPMKFQITQPTFWQGQERKPGDILEGQTGPMKYVRASNGKMEAIPLYVELPEATIPVMPVTTQPVTQLPPVPSPINEAPPVSVTGKHTLKEKFEAARARKASIDADVDSALTNYNAAADLAEGAIKSLNDDATALTAEVTSFTNGSPS